MTDTFRPYSWQQSAWEQILQQSRNDRLAHAYLLSGMAGSGRRHFATALSALLLCEQPLATRTLACGTCRQCLLFASGNHPDVLEIVPEENSTAIKIDQIRRLSEFVNQTSNQQNAWQLVIINPAAAMAAAAANSLLKSLEEPPGKTLFLLISDTSSQLLPTLRSRCQPLPLPVPSMTDTMSWLQQHSAAAAAELARAADLAPGQPYHALALLEQGIPDWRELLREKLTALAKRQESVTAVARFCEKQPYQYAIKLMLEISTEQIRQLSTQGSANQVAQLSQPWFRFQRELLTVNRQLQSTANPNLLMSLEHILTCWQDAIWKQSRLSSLSA